MLRIHYDDGVKSMYVTAEGKVFCAGGDLKLFHAWGDQMARNAHDMLIDFRTHSPDEPHPEPFVAGVRGAAGGAGMSHERLRPRGLGRERQVRWLHPSRA